jgi:hypothetical protein
MKYHAKLLVLLLSVLCTGQAAAQNARSQLDNVQYQSNSAAHASSSAGARTQAGSGMDNAAPSSTAVNVSGGTPGLLRNPDGTNPYSPYEGRPIHTVKPPPLP